MLSAKADTLQHNAKPAKVMKIRTLRVMHTLAFLRSKTVVVPAIPLPKLAEQQVLRNICKVFFISRLPMIILLEALACALPVMFLGRFLHNVGRSSAEVRLRLFGCRNLHSRSCRWYPSPAQQRTLVPETAKEGAFVLTLRVTPSSFLSLRKSKVIYTFPLGRRGSTPGRRHQ